MPTLSAEIEISALTLPSHLSEEFPTFTRCRKKRRPAVSDSCAQAQSADLAKSARHPCTRSCVCAQDPIRRVFQQDTRPLQGLRRMWGKENLVVVSQPQIAGTPHRHQNSPRPSRAKIGNGGGDLEIDPPVRSQKPNA